MMKKKSGAILVFLLFIVSLLGAQSLVELSKKEKERRAAIKGRRIVVTNKDLAKVKKKPAVIVAQPESPGEEAPEESADTAMEGPPPQEDLPLPSPEDQSDEESAVKPEQDSVLSDQEFQRRKAEYEERWNMAQERVDLLTLKMNALWQQFYAIDDMAGRAGVQEQISVTYSKLIQAQENAAKAKAELDEFTATARRESVPAIWVR